MAHLAMCYDRVARICFIYDKRNAFERDKKYVFK
jgi:hypothetical protein